MDLTIEELFILLGQKEAELFAIRRELANAKQALLDVVKNATPPEDHN